MSRLEQSREELGHFWAENEERVENGKVYLRAKLAASYVGVTDKCLLAWTKRGCPYFNGAALLAHPRVILGRSANFYLREDLDEIRQRRAKFPRTLRAATPAGFVTQKEAAKILGYNPCHVRRIRREGSRFLDGDITTQKVVVYSDRCLNHHIVFSLEELRRFRCKRDATPAGYLPVGQAAKKIGVKKGTLKQWCVDGCPHLGGRKPDAIAHPLRCNGMRRRALLVAVQDVEEIARIRPRKPRTGPQPRPERPKLEVYRDRGRHRWYPTRLACEEFGLRPHHLSYYAGAGRLRRDSRLDPHTGKRVYCYREKELLAVRDALVGKNESGAMPSANSVTGRKDGNLSDYREADGMPGTESRLQDINPYPMRTAEIGPKAREANYEDTRNAVRDGVVEAARLIGGNSPVTLIDAAPESLSNVKPEWDDDASELRWNSRLVCRYTAPAKNQRDIIEAFAKAGWPRRIDDPFKNPMKLNKTIADLNKKLQPGIIRFRSDGTGEGIIWDTCDNKI